MDSIYSTLKQGGRAFSRRFRAGPVTSTPEKMSSFGNLAVCSESLRVLLGRARLLASYAAHSSGSQKIPTSSMQRQSYSTPSIHRTTTCTAFAAAAPCSTRTAPRRPEGKEGGGGGVVAAAIDSIRSDEPARLTREWDRTRHQSTAADESVPAGRKKKPAWVTAFVKDQEQQEDERRKAEEHQRLIQVYP